MSKRLFAWGMNAYPSSPLKGCINDLIDYCNSLISRGFSCHTVTDEFATDSRILNEIKSSFDCAKPGDVLVFAGSSHGSYIPDNHGDELDRRDELICPIDFPKSYILDDDLRSLCSKIPDGVTVEFFLDNCYSGTATRTLSPQVHKIPVLTGRYIPFIGKSPSRRPSIKAGKKDKSSVATDMKEILFAACGEGQTSAEVLIGGLPRGAFSYYVCKCIRENPKYTRSQLIDYVSKKVALLGVNQIPQLECSPNRIKQVMFDGK